MVMKEKKNTEIETLKKSEILLYLSNVIEEYVTITDITPSSLFVKNNTHFNTTKYVINSHYKPIIVR